MRPIWQGWAEQRRARRRAEAIAARVLSAEERADLAHHGYFPVPSRIKPGRTYRIPAGGSPVAVLEPDGRVVYLCLQPAEPLPGAELPVIHKLLLEADEVDYWKKANRVGRAMGRGFGRRLFG